MSLVPRLFDVTSGTVEVDGVDVRDMDPEALWRRIGLVPQKAFLFTGTVASNLRYGDSDADDEQLWAALRIAQAEDFVRAMPEGLNSPIAQGGTNVSGGDVLGCERPQGFQIQLNIDDVATAERVFAKLADGGHVTVPLQQTFWAQRFGALVDRFGIPWGINCGEPQAA